LKSTWRIGDFGFDSLVLRSLCCVLDEALVAVADPPLPSQAAVINAIAKQTKMPSVRPLHFIRLRLLMVKSPSSPDT
jgi:hypothetical protein